MRFNEVNNKWWKLWKTWGPGSYLNIFVSQVLGPTSWIPSFGSLLNFLGFRVALWERRSRVPPTHFGVSGHGFLGHNSRRPGPRVPYFPVCRFYCPVALKLFLNFQFEGVYLIKKVRWIRREVKISK